MTSLCHNLPRLLAPAPRLSSLLLWLADLYMRAGLLSSL